MQEEDDLFSPASPWPVTGGHGMAVVLHLLNGALLIGLTLFSPPWAGPFPLASYGERFAEVASADLQWGVSGMIVFATVVSIAVSTLVTAAGFRLIKTFKKLGGGKRGAVLFGSLLLAHSVGCVAGVIAVMLASGVAFIG